ncbi:hypothetical protein [Spirochaeta thermophila]|uniref:Uncharacterized protein n=2 Tax=Winmispira thermophila TaxID=154 RepID=G0GDN1_WINT7|nr:hypothetical protein [Spirochaeta thermophila]ADN02023.1 hypothetical protein STHERM_c10780 [Spirochaeta thermophila DSM 6192]AEJ61378.1 hypothetical protein Spith_1106 [Spirochaeta thermophila DSM 6578]
MFLLNDKERLALYILLRRHEEELDPVLSRVKHRMEKWLFERLSIEEMSDVERVYLALKEGEQL